MSRPAVTIINDRNLRGIVAPPSVISKKMLEDFIDLVEYANPAVVARINRAFKKGGKLIDGQKLRKKLGV